MSNFDTVSLYSVHSVHSKRSALSARRKSRAEKHSIVDDDEIDRHRKSDTHFEVELPEHLVKGRKWVNSSFHQLRWIVITLASVGLGLTFILRLSITVAIVKMVNQTYVSLEEHYHDRPIFLEKLVEGNITIDPRIVDEIINPIAEVETGEFEWSNFVQSLIVNSYYVGYALPQVYISRLADIYGPNKPIVISQLIAILCTFIIPTTAYMGWEYLVALRFVIGITGAASFPISVGLIDVWIPYFENTKALTLLQFVSGSCIMINPLLTSYLCTFHWSVVSYVTGLIGAIWLILWLFIVRNTPEECWLISQKELKVIVANRRFQKTSKDTTDGNASDDSRDEERPSPPWRQVFTSWTFYAIVITWVLYDGTSVGFMNFLPTYLRTIMNFDIQQNGVATFTMMFAGTIAFVWGGNLLSLLTGHYHWNGSKARCLTFAIAAFGSSVMWLLPSFIDNYRIAFFITNKVLQPAIELVLLNTVMDQWSSLGLSGTMFSVYNTFASGLTVLFTWTAGYMLDVTGGDETSWNWLFVFFALVNIGSFFTYVTARPEKPLLDEPDDAQSVNSSNLKNQPVQLTVGDSAKRDNKDNPV